MPAPQRARLCTCLHNRVHHTVRGNAHASSSVCTVVDTPASQCALQYTCRCNDVHDHAACLPVLLPEQHYICWC